MLSISETQKLINDSPDIAISYNHCVWVGVLVSLSDFCISQSLLIAMAFREIQLQGMLIYFLPSSN